LDRPWKIQLQANSIESKRKKNKPPNPEALDFSRFLLVYCCRLLQLPTFLFIRVALFVPQSIPILAEWLRPTTNGPSREIRPSQAIHQPQSELHRRRQMTKPEIHSICFLKMIAAAI
jgi:hypothetical protein